MMDSLCQKAAPGRTSRSLSLSWLTITVFLSCTEPSTETHSNAPTIEAARATIPAGSFPCGSSPGRANNVLHLFSRPFHGTFALTNYFDHDLPFQFEDTNGFQLNSCGERITGRIDGHVGHDWIMPIGTAVFAVAAGEVIAAGTDPPFFCPVLNRTVTDQQFVEVLHDAVRDERFSSVYVHLSEIEVRVGDRVMSGRILGRSGNTGCSTEAHLHFHVWRHTNTNSGVPTRIDPFGWDGVSADPWATHEQGAKSVWLWREGEAPTLELR